MKDPIFAIGSCFSDNIGQKLADNKFDVVANPFGTIYNPYSIFKNIRLLLSTGLDPDNFVKTADVYYHWDTHSYISGTNLDTFKTLLNNQSLMSRQSLLTSRWMIITLGTIYVYKYLENGRIVANCHKIPKQHFDHLTLSTEEIIEDYFETMEVVRSVNPAMKVILTVSPVRHVRDGLIRNNISKATLLQVANIITEKDKNAFYFPAYEFMIDVLRDYRFYEEDMIHPNGQALDYIWKRFTETFMDADSRSFISEWTQVRKSLTHKPFHPYSANHQTFLKSTIDHLKRFEKKIDITQELKQLKKQLVKK